MKILYRWFGGLLIFLMFCTGIFAANEKSLQTLIDEAAASPQKKLVLAGKTYFVEKPIMLTNAHSGLIIEGTDGCAIDGGRLVSGWEREGDLLKAKLPVDIKRPILSLFVNNKRAKLAHLGDKEPFYMMGGPFSHDKSMTVTQLYSNAFKARKKDIAPLLKLPPEELAEVYVDCYISWWAPRYRLNKIVENPDGKTCDVYVYGDNSYSLHVWARYPRYDILNLKKALNEAGEFFFDKQSSTLYYKPLEGQTPENIKAYYCVTDAVLLGEGKSPEKPIKDILIKGVTFRHGFETMDENFNLIHKFVQASADTLALVRFDFARNIRIENCIFEHCDLYGLAYHRNVWDSIVENSEFRDTGVGGIRFGMTGMVKKFPTDELCADQSGRNTARNNIIYNYGRWNPSGVGIIIFDNPDNIVANNEIFDGYYTGISLGWSWSRDPTHTQNNQFLYNHISHLGLGLMDDFGGIYILGETSEGTRCIGNLIHDLDRHASCAFGLYNDNNSSHCTWEDNYVYAVQDCLYYKNFGCDNLVRNNIFIGDAKTTSLLGAVNQRPDSIRFEQNIVVYTGQTNLYMPSREPKIEQWVSANNIYWNESGVKVGEIPFDNWQAAGNDKGSIAAKPNLDDLANDPNVKKIGFKPFDISKAGVQNERMKKRLSKIMKNYPFTPIVSHSITPPFNLNIYENTAYMDANTVPTTIIISTDYPEDILVRTDNSKIKKFIRYSKRPMPAENLLPRGVYSPSITNKNFVIEFDFRSQPETCVTMNSRDYTKSQWALGPNFTIHNNRLSCESKSTPLPANEWVHVKMISDDNSWTLTLSADGKDFWTQKFQHDQRFDSLNWVGFYMGIQQKCTFDTANMKIEGLSKGE